MENSSELAIRVLPYISHTNQCNRHRFDGMTMLARQTMEDCGYNNDCDCEMDKIIQMLEEAKSDVG